ncbi:MFS transporter [Gilvimarinus xylanilyticus]|uniref:MFS transporter n=1 Tax=Gilvimarinus xylanilyticus TaxID=2944139 RepID=A0A9X2KTD6_9GAMM|nr:MFS transporter [Gilvimarinus xylanilyticus]MCP8899801.1 MFS transporter [Gilvimarinus xylanilyticus]
MTVRVDKISPDAWLLLCVVCLGAFIAPLGMASVNVAIPALAHELHANAVLVSWIPTTVLVANIMFMLPAGKLADLMGRKRVFQLGIGLNALACIGAFFATSVHWVLAMRFVQGVGSAMMFATSMALLISVFPAHKRGLPLGLNAASVYLGLTLAPALGGWATETFGWRAVFLLPLPLVMVVSVLLQWGIKGEWRQSEPSRFDWRGALLFALWAAFLVLGLTGLPEPLSVVALVLSLVLLGLFIRLQAGARSPLIRVQMFRESRVFSMSLLAAALMYGANYPLGFMLSLYLQYVRGFSALEAGQVLLSQALAMACVAPLSGKLSDIFSARWLASVGCICTLLGFYWLNQLDAQTPEGDIRMALVLIGIGFGFFSSPNNHVVMHSARASEVGVASATLNLARVTGNLVGMSLVNLLVYWHLGDSAMSAAVAQPLLATFHNALQLALGLLTVATLVSLLRGRATATASG